MQEFLLALYYAVQFYSYVIFARLLCSWLPNVDWYSQPFRLLNALTEPVLAPFRRILPPVGGMDFSPMLLFAVLWLVQNAIGSMLAGPF